ncbi:RNA polymerase sigma factor [Alteromonas ponticola]|uniref:RNA polymerase sigma factor n=1 Tax=Alteromonas aquimaris TaxID=2998417 RepID=A0ABT3P864_9ALTE|nr:RNA polymerase sigma factor [Alteromonas aquimaris]MCW8108947.1 RNA polymerase sigma factor [Alteromonas aquimaris]
MKLSFKEVWDKYGALLSRVASSYEANDALKQELLQEIVIAVWQALERFEGRSSVKVYVLKVAHNRAVSHVASQVRHPQAEEWDDQAYSPSSPAATPHGHAEQNQQLDRLLAEIRQLPLEQKQVITMSLEGLTYEEISQLSGLTQTHVGVMINRIKKSLSKRLNDEQ